MSIPNIHIACSTVDDGDLRGDPLNGWIKKQTNNLPFLVSEVEHGVAREFVHISKNRGKPGTAPQRSTKDALICDERGIALAIRFADCVPIVLADTKSNVFAFIHGGWRSLVQNILELTLADMQKEYGVRAKNLTAWMGPSLRSCCFMLQNPSLFLNMPAWKSFVLKKNGLTVLDPQAFIRHNLKEMGVPENHIVDSGICTYHAGKNGVLQYYSHRRAQEKGNKADDGRFAVAVWRET